MAKNRLSSLLPSSLVSDRRRSAEQHRRVSSELPHNHSLHVEDRGRNPYAKALPPLPPSQTHQRAVSANYLPAQSEHTQLSLRQLQDSTSNASLTNLSSLRPPPPIGGGSRSSSVDRSSRSRSPAFRPVSGPTSDQFDTMPNDSSKRGVLHRNKKDKHLGGDTRGPFAWIAGHRDRVPYDVDGLINGRPMTELCDDAEGNCFVFFWPHGSGKGASFRIDSAVFAASPILTKLAFGDLSSASGNRQSNISDSSITTSLFLPLTFKSPVLPTSTQAHLSAEALDDIQTLVDFRNFFGFLCGSSLIATERKSSLFSIFMTVAGILQSYEFSNVDGSTFGEVASTSFDSYVEELGLADVRTSREKTIESVVLGERMKSVLLYNEAFTHAAGKYDDLVGLKSLKFNLISSVTQNRLTRAAMDLEKRISGVQLILKDFDFPALFTGIMNSKMSEERKEGVTFGGWKDAFMGIRKYVLGLYNHRYGSWPPKAKSKKNDLETSGLNRRVLRDVYRDITSMYDLLVDRRSLTTRTADGIDLAADKEDAMTRALRSVLSEYDRSYPPVKPPMPFDLPKLPSLATTRKDASGNAMQDAKMFPKKLKDDEIAKILRASWNDDAEVTPFVEAFRDMEKRAAHGCTIGEIIDLRIGQWIFMYVVLQALPLLACDAPVVKHSSGVEYFLCEPPRRGVPWSNTVASGAGGVTGGQQRQWFSVGDGSNVVSLPADLIEHGIEGIYRRSHCWVMAEKWSASNPVLNGALHEQEQMNANQLNNLAPPPGLMPPGSSSRRTASPAGSYSSRRVSAIGLGLEALPLPPGVTPDGRPVTPDGIPVAGSRSASRTPVHNVDSSKTFDAILATAPQQTKKGKKK